MRIVPIAPAYADDWAAMRRALWPEIDAARRREVAARFAAPSPDILDLIAFDAAVRALGFAEARIRRDHVNGCDVTPVLFLEGLYVVRQARRQGVARRLVDAVAAWSAAQGLIDFASDAPIDNDASYALHAALGFAETERVVVFRRMLGAA